MYQKAVQISTKFRKVKIGQMAKIRPIWSPCLIRTQKFER
jgi:hypothetical protein